MTAQVLKELVGELAFIKRELAGIKSMLNTPARKVEVDQQASIAANAINSGDMAQIKAAQARLG